MLALSEMFNGVNVQLSSIFPWLKFATKGVFESKSTEASLAVALKPLLEASDVWKSLDWVSSDGLFTIVDVVSVVQNKYCKINTNIHEKMLIFTQTCKIHADIFWLFILRLISWW